MITINIPDWIVWFLLVYLILKRKIIMIILTYNKLEVELKCEHCGYIIKDTIFIYNNSLRESLSTYQKELNSVYCRVCHRKARDNK